MAHSDDTTAPGGRPKPPSRPQDRSSRPSGQPRAPSPALPPDEDRTNIQAPRAANARPGRAPTAPPTDEETEPRVETTELTPAEPPQRAGTARPRAAAVPVKGAAPGRPVQRNAASRGSASPQKPSADPTKRWSVLPDEPGRTPTAAQRLVGVQRNWQATLIALGGSIALAMAGLWLWGRGNQVFGVVLLVLILPVTFTALFVKRAPCPKCGRPVTIIGIDRCRSCNTYIRIEENRVLLVEKGFVADNPTFEFECPLPVVMRLEWPWKEHCIVCGQPAGANDERVDVQGTEVVLPHCGEHEGGAVWSLGVSESAVTMVKFRFRSFDFWNEFLEKNAIHTRAGLWR